MKNRCLNPNDRRWAAYGGRGIKVCARWLEAYENFLADMGRRPSSKHSLDRYPNNDGNYEPTNCRWATPSQQARNTRDNHRLTHNGETLALVEWQERTGIHWATIKERVCKLGWTVERALTQPVDVNRRNTRARQIAAGSAQRASAV